MDLSAVRTFELVEELKNREGVQIEYAESHEDKTLSINDPAYIFVVVD